MDDEILTELRQIRLALELLTSKERTAVRTLFNKRVLRTDERATMFWAVDGQKDADALAAGAGVSVRAAQRLIKDMEDAGWVTISQNRRTRIPTMAFDKIVAWYHAEAAEGTSV